MPFSLTPDPRPNYTHRTNALYLYKGANNGSTILAVFDGLGGQAGGETAPKKSLTPMTT